MNSLSGKLLIAEPRLPDSNFVKTVVYIIAHTDEGASGLILNRPSNVSLQDVWDQVSDSPLARDEVIFIGGPVEGPLAAIHDNPVYSEEPLRDGFHLSMKRHNLDPILADEAGFVRVFSGYSGWAPGQLDNELDSGGWLVFEATGEHFSIDHEALYQKVCNQLGKQILFGDKSNLPDSIDPSAN